MNTILFSFVIVALSALVGGDKLSSNPHIRILSQELDVPGDGTYSYAFETENGIAGAESGLGGQSAQGYSQYTAPDGTPIQLTYKADENGFHPEGAHLPVGPPIPPQILKALEYIRTHPQKEEKNYY